MSTTAGPWKAYDEETHWSIYANGNHLVARIPIRKSSWESDKDNARLITSAPTLRTQNAQLLAALERADDNMDTLAENLRAGLTAGALSLIQRFRDDARAAIASIKEEQK